MHWTAFPAKEDPALKVFLPIGNIQSFNAGTIFLVESGFRSRTEVLRVNRDDFVSVQRIQPHGPDLDETVNSPS
jgi:hypothetical protein